jgi:hypothetical protein
MKNNKNKKSSPWKSIQVGLVSLLVMVIFAYGFQITRVNLEELRSEKRQESLIRVTRALAKPDIIAYDQEEEVVNFPIHVPCPADGNIADAPIQLSLTLQSLPSVPAPVKSSRWKDLISPPTPSGLCDSFQAATQIMSYLWAAKMRKRMPMGISSPLWKFQNGPAMIFNTSAQPSAGM